MTAAAFIFGVVFGLLGYVWISAPERRRAEQRVNRALTRADVAIDVAAQTLIERNLMLAWFGGDNPEALAAEVKVSGRALRDERRDDADALDWLDETTWPGGAV